MWRAFCKLGQIFAMLLLPVVLLSWWEQELVWQWYACLWLGMVLAFVFLEQVLPDSIMSLRESFLLLPVSWVGLSVVATLPFYVGQPMLWIDAWFAAVSGITTTGAEVFPDLGLLPKSLLFYRMWLQFLGGLGIVVLAMAWSSIAKNHAGMMLRTDLPGPVKTHSFAPKIGEAAHSLWTIYVTLYFLCAGLCYQFGMSAFEALCESMAIVSTGGFGLYNDNLAHYASTPIYGVVIASMLLGSINYILHYQYVVTHQLTAYYHNKEFGLYMIMVCVLLIVSHGVSYLSGNGLTFLDMTFMVVSLVSTAGHQVVAITSIVPAVALLLTFFCMLGGCSGSTAGGIKMLRLRFFTRDFTNALAQLIHPQAVFSSYLDTPSSSQSDFVLVRGFLLAYLMVLSFGWWCLVALGVDIVQAFSMVVACLSNTGLPVLGYVSHYAQLSVAAKFILTLLMLFGRVELMGFFLLIGLRRAR